MKYFEFEILMSSILAIAATLFSTSSFAVLERITDDRKIESLKQDWEIAQKESSITDSELIKLIASKEFENVSISFSKVFKPISKNSSVFASPQYNKLTFRQKNESDDSQLSSKVYHFKSCKKLSEIFQKNLLYNEIGSASYIIKYNEYFVIHDGKVLFKTFYENCKRLAEENEYQCPEYTERSDTLKSKVGPLLTFESNSHGGGACGPPYHSTTLESIDLRTHRPANILDFFDEKDLLDSLRKDPAVINSYGGSRSVPKKLKTIVGEVPGMELGGFTLYDFDLRSGRFRIRWASNSYECGMCPNHYTLLGLDVRPKPWFKDTVKSLEAKKELPGVKVGL